MSLVVMRLSGCIQICEKLLLLLLTYKARPNNVMEEDSWVELVLSLFLETNAQKQSQHDTSGLIYTSACVKMCKPDIKRKQMWKLIRGNVQNCTPCAFCTFALMNMHFCQSAQNTGGSRCQYVNLAHAL